MPRKRRPRLLDLFCGQGGAAKGYADAGFDVTGIDIEPQPRYPFRFIQADAMAYVVSFGHRFDVIHASPPCQRWSKGTFCRQGGEAHPDLLTPMRQLLDDTGKVWVIENVMGSPVNVAAVLCGLMFDLKVFRHRAFESNVLLFSPPHQSHEGKRIGKDGMVCVAGHGDAGRRHRERVPADHRNKASWERAMQIDWMSRDGLAQAIPPAYTRFIGFQLKRAYEIASAKD